MEAATVLDALGDPTRRRVLEGAGLVRERRDGTRHLYVVADDGLGALRAYLETFWDAALAAFARAATAAADEQGGATR